MSILSWGFPLALAFVTTPILLGRLGNELYGVYALVLGFLTFTFSTGTGKVAAKYVPEYRASGDGEGLSESVSAVLWLTVGLGTIQGLLLAALAGFIVKDILIIAPDLQPTVASALYIAAVAGFLLMVAQVFQSVLQGLHRFDIFAVFVNVSSLLTSGGTIVLVVLGFGIVAIVIWYAMVAGAALIFIFFRTKPLLPEWNTGHGFSRGVFVNVARYAGSIILYQAAVSILYLFERSWIVRKFGAESLSYYVVPLMLAVYMHGLVHSFSLALFPALNELLSEPSRLLKLYMRATKVTAAGAVLITSSYFVAGHLFLGLWLGAGFADRAYQLLAILAVAFALNILGITAWMLAETFRAPGINAVSSMLWMGVAIPAIIIGASHWGIYGVAVGRLVGVSFSVPLILYIERRFLGRPLLGFWAKILLKLAGAAVVSAVVEKLLFAFLPQSWIGLFLVVGSGVASFAAFLWATRYFSKDETEIALSYFRRLFPQSAASAT